MKKVLSTLILGLLALTSFAKDKLIVAPAPTGIELKHDFEVKARIHDGEWQDVSTYAFKVDRVANAKHNVEITSVAKFEFEGKVEIQVKSIAQDIKSYKIRPNSYGITAIQEGNTLTFSLDRPRNLSVEINGNIYQNLQIFADNVLEKPKVKKKKDLIYFGPGIHDFKGDSIHIASGKTVFIDNGAVIKGWLSTYGSNHVKILGHGIVMPGHHEGIMVRYAKNIDIDGPITTQLPIGGSDSVTVKNVKVMSWYGWGDGDNILVKGITFQNFHIDNIRKGMIVNMRVCFNKKYCTAPGRGIEDITLRNIAYTGEMPNMGIIAGYDQSRMVKNIRFENFTINGKVITDDMPGKPKWYKTADMANIYVNDHVENLIFTK